jgi:hypothetical protein
MREIVRSRHEYDRFKAQLRNPVRALLHCAASWHRRAWRQQTVAPREGSPISAFTESRTFAGTLSRPI